MSVSLKIINGAAEIGGSCVEILSEKTRIILDCGLPLTKDSDFQISNLSSIIADDRDNYILISHAHLDHYGALNYLNSDCKIFLGEATHELIKISNVFSSNKCTIGEYEYFETGKTFEIGEFSVTAYLMDHSAFDSYAFFIKIGDKSILYSGDFRNHGRKSNNRIPCLNPDYLLLEGTGVSREDFKNQSEYEIENKLTEIFKTHKGLNLIYTSSQNIDRLVSIYKACKKAKKQLVIDIYTASILKALSKSAKLPFPSQNYSDIFVFFSSFVGRKLSDSEKSEYLFPHKEFKITRQEIIDRHNDIVLLTRASLQPDIEKLTNITPGAFVYSLWSGYAIEGATKKFCDYIKSLDFQDFHVHTSGHADKQALLEFVDKIKPSTIIPIHTNNPEAYSELFAGNKVKIANNCELINI